MNKLFNTVIGLSFIAVSTTAISNELISELGGASEIPTESISQVIQETAEATLFPNGSETKSNCRKDSHCVAFTIANNCISANYSKYKSHGAEEAILKLAQLINSSNYYNTICAREVVKGVCEEKRCDFVATGEIAY